MKQSSLVVASSLSQRRLLPPTVLLAILLGSVIGTAYLPYFVIAAIGTAVAVFVLGMRIRRVSDVVKVLSVQWYEAVVLPPSRSHSRQLQRWFSLALILILLALNVYAPAQPALIQRLLASLIIALAAVPTWLWLSGRDRGIPFLPFLAGIYALYYALPIFLLTKYSRAWYLTRIIPNSFLDQALALSLIGLGLLLLGYYGVHHRVLASVVPKVTMQWSDYGSVKLLAVTLGILGISTYYINLVIPFPLSIQQAVNFAADLSLLAICMLFILQLTGRLGLFATGLLWGVLVPTRMLLGFSTGATAQGLEPVLLLLLTYAALKHHLPQKTLVAAGVLLILLLPVRAPFRALTWGGGEAANRSPTEKAALYVAIAGDFLTGEALPYSDAVQISMSRLAHLTTFAEVIETTPASVPFWRGETYYPLLFKVIPRFLYPDKPVEVTGQTFGHRYGFLAPSDLTTSYNLPQLVEFYANFGVLGVLLGMFFVGVVYRIIQHIFIHSGMGLGAVVASIYLFTGLLLIESALSMVLGGLVWGFVLLGLVHLVMIVVERRKLRRA